MILEVLTVKGKGKDKGKQFLHFAGHALRVPGFGVSQVSRLSVNECSKFISPKKHPPYPPRDYSWYSFLLEAESS